MSQSQLKQFKQSAAQNSTNPHKLTNPATISIEWKAGNGEFVYYNKDTKQNVVIGKKLECLVLNQLYTLRGWTPDGNALISNEVANPGKQDFYVREYYTTQKGEKSSKLITNGNWKKEIKGNQPVNFYASLYAVCLINGGDQLVNIRIGGSGLSSLIKAKIRPEDGFTTIFTAGKKQKTGMVSYHELDINQTVEVSNELSTHVMSHYEKLNEYLNQYFTTQEETGDDTASSFFSSDDFEDTDFVPAD